MPEFTIEFTSENVTCPTQRTIEAANPWKAIQAALRGHGIRPLLRDYDRTTDPNHSYKGWSHVTISIDCNPDGVREFERDEIPGYEVPDDEKCVECGEPYTAKDMEGGRCLSCGVMICAEPA